MIRVANSASKMRRGVKFHLVLAPIAALASGDESGDFVRRARHAAAGRDRVSAQAYGADRHPADSLAYHEDLRKPGPQRLHPLPGLQGGDDQEFLPKLPLDDE